MLSLMGKVGPSATDMIRADHTRVVVAFHRYKADSAPSRKQAIAGMVCTALQVHAKIEEEIFYPAMRQAGSTLLEDLEPEHEEMRTLIATLSGMQPTDPQYDLTYAYFVVPLSDGRVMTFAPIGNKVFVFGRDGKGDRVIGRTGIICSVQTKG